MTESIREIGRVQLKSDDRSSFCPYCMKEMKNKGLDYRTELKDFHLFAVVVMETFQVEGTWKRAQDTKYYCTRCRKYMDRNAIINNCTCRSDGTRWDEKPGPELLKVYPTRPDHTPW